VDNTPSNGLPPTRTYVISQKYSTRIHADIKPGLSCGGFAWRFQQSATRPSQVPKLRALHIPAPLLRAREKQAFLAGSFKRKPPRTADMGDISTVNTAAYRRATGCSSCPRRLSKKYAIVVNCRVIAWSSTNADYYSAL